jgi:hypothetical protein
VASSRVMPWPAIGLSLGLAALVLPGCLETVDSCDRYAEFAEAMAETCPDLAWSCEDAFPRLGPAAAQDLDWCIDCVQARATDASDLDCGAAPLSARPCGEILDETLDTSCFAATE